MTDQGSIADVLVFANDADRTPVTTKTGTKTIR